MANENEIMKSNKTIDLSGFKIKDDLNPKIWDENKVLQPEVRKRLLKIANDYFESLELPDVDIIDVTFTGSLANYNWSKYSDVDLHIVIDYDEIEMEENLREDFLALHKNAWNDKHNIKVYGYEVEIYVQNEGEPHHSTGIYSVLNNDWDIEPEHQNFKIDNEGVKRKANVLMDMIEDVYDSMDGDKEVTIEKVDKLKDKISKMRSCGLEEGGEFSIENMAFKVLRRNGMMERLGDIKIASYDDMMTLEQKKNLKEGDFDWYDEDSSDLEKLSQVLGTRYKIDVHRDGRHVNLVDTSFPNGKNLITVIGDVITTDILIGKIIDERIELLEARAEDDLTEYGEKVLDSLENIISILTKEGLIN
jgi:hypothetical protein